MQKKNQKTQEYMFFAFFLRFFFKINFFTQKKEHLSYMVVIMTSALKRKDGEYFETFMYDS